jgi:hypothetical protein
MSQKPDTTPAIKITNWKAFEKKTLRGFFTMTLPSGLRINDAMLHEKGDSRWISFPAREYTDSKGERQFSNIIEFVDRTTADRFRDHVLAALDRHFAEVGHDQRETQRT